MDSADAVPGFLMTILVGGTVLLILIVICAVAVPRVIRGWLASLAMQQKGDCPNCHRTISKAVDFCPACGKPAPFGLQ